MDYKKLSRITDSTFKKSKRLTDSVKEISVGDMPSSLQGNLDKLLYSYVKRTHRISDPDEVEDTAWNLVDEGKINQLVFESDSEIKEDDIEDIVGGKPNKFEIKKSNKKWYLLVIYEN